MDVGARPQTIRKLEDLSQRELARRAGVTDSIIPMTEKDSVSPSISPPRKVLGGIPMSLVEFFSLDLEQDNHIQVVYKADEPIDISSGTVPVRLVGKAYLGRTIVFLGETYSSGSGIGKEMLNHEGEEAGVLVDGRLELTAGSETYVLEHGNSYYFESSEPHRFRSPYDISAHLISVTTPASF